MKVRFNPEALEEYENAALYYLSFNAPLARRFIADVEATVRRMRTHPLAYALVDEDIRRCLAKKFPFGVYYTVEEDFLLIVAVMHLSRMPSYWKERV